MDTPIPILADVSTEVLQQMIYRVVTPFNIWPSARTDTVKDKEQVEIARKHICDVTQKLFTCHAPTDYTDEFSKAMAFALSSVARLERVFIASAEAIAFSMETLCAIKIVHFEVAIETAYTENITIQLGCDRFKLQTQCKGAYYWLLHLKALCGTLCSLVVDAICAHSCAHVDRVTVPPNVEKSMHRKVAQLIVIAVHVYNFWAFCDASSAQPLLQWQINMVQEYPNLKHLPLSMYRVEDLSDVLHDASCELRHNPHLGISPQQYEDIVEAHASRVKHMQTRDTQTQEPMYVPNQSKQKKHANTSILQFLVPTT